MIPPALALCSITRRYRAGVAGCSAEVTALDGVSLTVPAGDCVGIVGETGAGKSTLLLCACGILPVEQGTVMSAQAAYVPPHGVEHPYLSVRASLEFGVAERELRSGTGTITAAAIIERARLTEYATLRVGELTAGLRARVALAHALIQEPKLLCIDEPQVPLSPAQRMRYGVLLAELRAEGMAVLMAARRTSALRGLATRVVTLDRGRVVAGVPGARTLELDVSAPRLAATALADRIPSVVRRGRALRVVLDDVSAEEVMSTCRALGINVYGSRVIGTAHGRVAEDGI